MCMCRVPGAQMKQISHDQVGLAMKTNLLQLFSIIVKMYVLNFELLNKIKIRNKINLYSIHLKCDSQNTHKYKL